MKQSRREFLRKTLKVGAVAGTVGAVSLMADQNAESNGVASGKSKKKEILYHKTAMWEKYYKIAY